MVATVFISHSCKDNEAQPPPELSKEQAAARAERLAFSRRLRDQLHAALKKDKRFEVFLDVRGGLEAGDVWRDGLHTALRKCSAGIVLLTPESLKSGWVRKEATILSWRVFLGEPVVLIPIVLGVTNDDLDQQGFGALDLDAIQWVKVGSSDTAALKAAVKETIAALDTKLKSPLVDAAKLKPTEIWIKEFAASIGKVIGTPAPDLKNHYLVSMCDELAIDPEDRVRFDEDPLVNIASQVLLADDNQVVRFLRHVGAPDEAQREMLRDAVAALWVDAAPASRLLGGAGQVIAIDAAETASAREYLVRARCNKVDWGRVAQPTDVTDGSDAQVLAEIKERLEEVVPIDSKDALEADIDENGPVYVILGPGSARPSVLETVTASYPKVTFIVAAGAKPAEKLGSWRSRALLLYPLLQPATREAAAFRFRNRLKKFVKGMANE